MVPESVLVALGGFFAFSLALLALFFTLLLSLLGSLLASLGLFFFALLLFFLLLLALLGSLLALLLTLLACLFLGLDLVLAFLLGALGGFLVDLGGRVVASHHGRVAGVFFLLVAGVLLEREGVLVASSPVILELAVSPQLLEGGLTGILGHRVVEVPRVVAVDVVASRLLSVVLQTGALSLLLSHVGFTLGILFFFFLLFLEVFDNLGYYLLLLLKGHAR